MNLQSRIGITGAKNPPPPQVYDPDLNLEEGSTVNVYPTTPPLEGAEKTTAAAKEMVKQMRQADQIHDQIHDQVLEGVSDADKERYKEQMEISNRVETASQKSAIVAYFAPYAKIAKEQLEGKDVENLLTKGHQVNDGAHLSFTRKSESENVDVYKVVVTKEGRTRAFRLYIHKEQKHWSEQKHLYLNTLSQYRDTAIQTLVDSWIEKLSTKKITPEKKQNILNKIQYILVQHEEKAQFEALLELLNTWSTELPNFNEEESENIAEAICTIQHNFLIAKNGIENPQTSPSKFDFLTSTEQREIKAEQRALRTFYKETQTLCKEVVGNNELSLAKEARKRAPVDTTPVVMMTTVEEEGKESKTCFYMQQRGFFGTFGAIGSIGSIGNKIDTSSVKQTNLFRSSAAEQNSRIAEIVQNVRTYIEEEAKNAVENNNTLKSFSLPLDLIRLYSSDRTSPHADELRLAASLFHQRPFSVVIGNKEVAVTPEITLFSQNLNPSPFNLRKRIFPKPVNAQSYLQLHRRIRETVKFMPTDETLTHLEEKYLLANQHFLIINETVKQALADLLTVRSIPVDSPKKSHEETRDSESSFTSERASYANPPEAPEIPRQMRTAPTVELFTTETNTPACINDVLINALEISLKGTIEGFSDFIEGGFTQKKDEIINNILKKYPTIPSGIRKKFEERFIKQLRDYLIVKTAIDKNANFLEMFLGEDTNYENLSEKKAFTESLDKSVKEALESIPNDTFPDNSSWLDSFNFAFYQSTVLFELRNPELDLAKTCVKTLCSKLRDSEQKLDAVAQHIHKKHLLLYSQNKEQIKKRLKENGTENSVVSKYIELLEHLLNKRENTAIEIPILLTEIFQGLQSTPTLFSDEENTESAELTANIAKRYLDVPYNTAFTLTHFDTPQFTHPAFYPEEIQDHLLAMNDAYDFIHSL